MTHDNKETIESMPLCGGELKLVRRKIHSAYYEHSSDPSSNLEVWFCINSEQRIVGNFRELASIILDLNCKLNNWLQACEIEFSLIIAPLLNLGRVVSSTELYSFIDEKYGIPVSQNLPRIEGGHLRFLCGQFRLEDEPTIADISVDIESLEFDIQYLVSPTSESLNE